jgi:hypothetical protein
VDFGGDDHTIRGLIFLLSNVTGKALKMKKAYGKGGTPNSYKNGYAFYSFH